MNRIDLQTAPSGFPLTADKTLDFMQQTYLDAVDGLARIAGGAGNTIVSGVEQVGGTYTAGWLYVGGELVAFVGGSGTPASSILVEEVAEAAVNQDGSTVNRYFTKTARFGSGPGAIALSTFKRGGTLVSLQGQAANLVNFEPAVIVDGCIVSGVSGTTSGTLSISAGTYVLDGAFVAAAGYTGAFPVWFSVAGYATSDPGGTSVKFDPYTSQYKADVLARATTKVGELKDVAVLSDRFDPATGLGKWEWKGFALCDGRNSTLDLRGRTRFGHDPRTSDPGGGVWDANYNTPGNAGGAKEVTLTIGQIPSHNHTGEPAGTLAPGEFGLIRKSVSGEDVTIATSDAGQSGTEPDVKTSPQNVPYQGGGGAHENRPPYLVVVTAQRI